VQLAEFTDLQTPHGMMGVFQNIRVVLHQFKMAATSVWATTQAHSSALPVNVTVTATEQYPHPLRLLEQT
jgi:hypothetical protein